MKKIRVIGLLGYWVIALLNSVFAQGEDWQEICRGNLDFKTVLVDSKDPRIIYAGKKNVILKTEDGGESWRSILSIAGQNKTVNFLLFDPQDRNSLYVATGNGLFYSANQGNDWKRIFHGKNYLENDCTALAILSDSIYLGTKAGLFVSKDKGRSWHKESGKIGDSYILTFAYNLKEPNYLYVASIDGVFKTQDNGQSWERVFLANSTEYTNDIEEEIEAQDEEERLSNIRYIALDPNNLNHIYLSTSRGVYKSQDRAKTWEPVSSYGLLNQDVQFLLISEHSHLYAVTKSGVFEYRDERWQELSFNLSEGKISFLSFDNQNNLYVACDKGLFKANIRYFSNRKEDNILSLYFQNEPQINDVQKAAINYAEVDPEKIYRWRKAAAKRSFLPRVTTGINRDASDLWHWESGSTTKTGDDLLIRGRETVGWDITLTWDFGEMLWNNDQTSIDVRSRLMVQLREDILDEVTKLYFERIRVKMELDNLPIEDRRKRFEKEIRLQELTASLDALTGGYFSQQINKNKA